jgi:hypothetical protein
MSGKDEDKISRSEDDSRAQPISDRVLAIFFVVLATALVLGYLLLSKLADMSTEEDCALAHRRNCGASAIPLVQTDVTANSFPSSLMGEGGAEGVG